MSTSTTPTPRAPSSGRTLIDWRPEDPLFWQQQGRGIANRNLWISIPALLLAFVVWQVWSIVTPQLSSVGFKFTKNEMFWLTGLAGLSGATLRIFYSFMVPIFGGRRWTALTTLSLVIPCIGVGYAVRDPNTPYVVFVVLALLAGLGGGNFASSMSNISFFYPRKEKGNALAMNAGLGNLGVSVVQFVVPVAIVSGLLGTLGGEPLLAGANKTPLWLQNAGLIWVPLIVICSLAAWFGMNDIASAKASFAEQSVIFKRKHNWLMCWLYMGTFGSFIGFGAAFPLLIKTQFPEVNALHYVFLGPLIGALSRTMTGWVSDKVGGGRVTLWVFIMMLVCVLGLIYFIEVKSFPGFFTCFLLLFFATGVGNASTFQMIPNIMRQQMIRLMPNATPEERQREVEKESAAITGFTSAFAAYGFFIVPAMYALIGPVKTQYLNLLFYISCVVITYVVYIRKGGVLYDVERNGKFWTPGQAPNQ